MLLGNVFRSRGRGRFDFRREKNRDHKEKKRKKCSKCKWYPSETRRHAYVQRRTATFGAPCPEPPDRRGAVDSDDPKERPRLRGNPDNTRWQGYHHRNVRDERLHRACPCHPRGNAKGIQSKCQPGCPASELAWTLQRPDQRGESETRTAHAWPVQSVQQRVREERGVPAVRRKSFFTLHCRHS